MSSQSIYGGASFTYDSSNSSATWLDVTAGVVVSTGSVFANTTVDLLALIQANASHVSATDVSTITLEVSGLSTLSTTTATSLTAGVLESTGALTVGTSITAAQFEDIKLIDTSANTPAITYANTSNVELGRIQYNVASDRMEFYTGGVFTTGNHTLKMTNTLADFNTCQVRTSNGLYVLSGNTTLQDTYLASGGASLNVQNGNIDCTNAGAGTITGRVITSNAGMNCGTNLTCTGVGTFDAVSTDDTMTVGTTLTVSNTANIGTGNITNLTAGATDIQMKVYQGGSTASNNSVFVRPGYNKGVATDDYATISVADDTSKVLSFNSSVEFPNPVQTNSYIRACNSEPLIMSRMSLGNATVREYKMYCDSSPVNGFNLDFFDGTTTTQVLTIETDDNFNVLSANLNCPNLVATTATIGTVDGTTATFDTINATAASIATLTFTALEVEDLTISNTNASLVIKSANTGYGYVSFRNQTLEEGRIIYYNSTVPNKMSFFVNGAAHEALSLSQDLVDAKGNEIVTTAGMTCATLTADTVNSDVVVIGGTATGTDSVFSVKGGLIQGTPTVQGVQAGFLSFSSGVFHNPQLQLTCAATEYASIDFTAVSSDLKARIVYYDSTNKLTIWDTASNVAVDFDGTTADFKDTLITTTGSITGAAVNATTFAGNLNSTKGQLITFMGEQGATLVVGAYDFNYGNGAVSVGSFGIQVPCNVKLKRFQYSGAEGVGTNYSTSTVITFQLYVNGTAQSVFAFCNFSNTTNGNTTYKRFKNKFSSSSTSQVDVEPSYTSTYGVSLAWQTHTLTSYNTDNIRHRFSVILETIEDL